MFGLYDRDFKVLTKEDEIEKNRIDSEGGHVIAAKFGRRNFYFKYPEAVRRYMSLFPNNLMDVVKLKNIEELQKQCNKFELLLDDTNITELNIKRFIQDNGFYHIPASIFGLYTFGHHEAALFKEFPLGNRYKADYLLAGRASGGWQFVYVEFENPYGSVTLEDGNIGDVIRKGLNQIDEWKTFIESNYSIVKTEFERYTNEPLPKEFTSFDSTRMHYVVVAGRRNDYLSDTARLHQRRIEQERKIKIIHYDNLLDETRRLIGKQTY